MKRKSSKNTKGKIIAAAWKLFYEQGFDDTTVEDIVFESSTSKGSFYHYFDSKNALMNSLADMFDEKYEALVDEIDPKLSTSEKLSWLNQQLFKMIGETVSVDLLSRLLSSQVLDAGSSLLDHKRFYFKLLRSIISEGQKNGDITKKFTVDEIIHDYAMIERALMYDWCMNNGDYDLAKYASRIIPNFLKQYLP